MKRFYKDVSVAEQPRGGWCVRLDGQPVNTPLKAPLILPSRALAEAVAAEWAAQGDQIRPAAMPLTQIAATAIDRVTAVRAEIVDALIAYAETDLLCYRAARPAGLAARQAAIWQPLLDWLTVTFDAPLKVTDGIRPIAQPAEALAALRAAIAGLDDMTLSGLQAATAPTGSLVLALAILSGRLSAEAASAAALLDELYQVEHWGDDPEAALRRQALAADVAAAARFLACLRPAPA